MTPDPYAPGPFPFKGNPEADNTRCELDDEATEALISADQNVVPFVESRLTAGLPPYPAA